MNATDHPASHSSSKRGPILTAVAVLLIAGALLAWRVSSRTSQAQPSMVTATVSASAPPPAVAPPAKVPTPPPLRLDDLPHPRILKSVSSPRFEMDLDLFAPLGDGEGNAALWLRDFAKGDGYRLGQSGGEDQIEVDLLGKKRKVLPADHPLLLEAEPWMDQANCSFYPEVWRIWGWGTPIPNLLHTLILGRSWVHRGLAQDSAAMGLADMRRTIRLGRLLRQDDATVIQELVAIGIIRMGLEGLHEHARRHDDALLAAFAAQAIGECAMIRHGMANGITSAKLSDKVVPTTFGFELSLTDQQLDRVVSIARSHESRALRMEATLQLQVVKGAGNRSQRRLANEVLSELRSGPDELVATLATWADQVTLEEVGGLEGLAKMN